VVPPAEPRTKPKALTFALPFARGDYVVVFDAEDRPEPDQLRKAASAFCEHPELGCVQRGFVRTIRKAG
jgi:cellulose synthase/poly-beta-1,6-N-acetylglucosamine synthase-like glycosyltransferase